MVTNGRIRFVTPASSVTSIGDIFRPSLDIPSFDMLCKRLKDRLPVKLAIFPVISGTTDKYMIITDLK